MFDQELVCAAAINRIFPGEPGISCALYNLYGSYSRLFSLSFPELESLLGKRKKVAEAISDPKTLMDAEQELARLDSMGYKAFHRQSGDYPGALLECNDSPAIIFIKGGINLNYKNIISVVGTRRSTPYGESSCRRVVRELAMSGNNPVIVSGLAYGIDITAHRAALDNGLQTIAVLPCGPDRIYPSSHSATAERIALFGALLTEFPEGTPSYKLNFIQRNRIIAGVSRATIVIESDIKGGALTTAELAQGYSREVYALPGRFGDRASSGCNMLISKNIAAIYFSTQDFLFRMGWKEKSCGTLPQTTLFDPCRVEKEKIFVALKNNPLMQKDDLLRATGLNIKVLSAILLEMELDNIITPVAGGRYIAEREIL